MLGVLANLKSKNLLSKTVLYRSVSGDTCSNGHPGFQHTPTDGEVLKASALPEQSRSLAVSNRQNAILTPPLIATPSSGAHTSVIHLPSGLRDGLTSGSYWV